MMTDINREGLTFTNKDGQTVFTFKGIVETGIGKVETIDDLEDGDIITLRNGNRLLYVDDDFVDISVPNDNNICDINDLNDDLTYYDSDYKNNDVIQVERPIKYTTVFERENEPVEMTLSEICEKLGYEVKIVKEEE